MRKQRIYKGCELTSPTYRQVATEMASKKGGETQVINEYKTKRGKYSNKTKLFATHHN